MSVAAKNCVRRIARAGKKRLELPMLETAQPPSEKKANLILGWGSGERIFYREIIKGGRVNFAAKERVFAKSGNVPANRNVIRRYVQILVGWVFAADVFRGFKSYGIF